MRGLLLVVVLGGIAARASADPRSITGTVTAARSHWTADGSRIVTEATVRTASGDVVVSELGGTVDGMTMRTMPGPPVLDVGMQVAVTAHDDVDLAQRPYVVVDDVALVGASVAPQFVRTGPTKAGHYLYWESGCIFVTPDSAGTTEIAGDGEFPIITASIATWNTDTETPTCSYMDMKELPAKPMEVGKDEVNVIKFRDTVWGRPAIGDDPARMYAASAAGITTATYIDDASSSRDGAIVDADVEINGVNFAIAINGQTLGSASCIAELQNTMTHELGHVHGLQHTCLAPGDPPRIDNNGNPVPECADTTDPMILDATMYNFQDCGETKKETLEVDDTSAICTIYPTASDPGTCKAVEPPGGGCCDAGRDPGGALALAGLVGLILARRKQPAVSSR
ncbi:MAG TPA: hypothetical protein VLX92_23700 [Kofleriaceae bacterium]|nr:hypothetical protein [Kofleriaceae bacterium]